MYKQLMVNKGVWVLLVFCVIWSGVSISTSFQMNQDTYYYREYSMPLLGMPSDKKEELLNQWELELQTSEDEDVYETKKEALERVKEQYEQVKQYHTKGYNVEYVYEIPWDYFFGNAFLRRDVVKLGVCFAVMIVMLASSGALEEKNSTYRLIVATAVGKRGVRKRKLLIFETAACMVAATVILPDIMKIQQKFGMFSFWAPSGAYFKPTFWLAGVSLGMLLILKYVIFVMTVLMETAVMFLISEKVGNRIVTIFIGSGMFLIPVFLMMLLWS